MNKFGRRRRNLLAYSVKAGLLCLTVPGCTKQSIAASTAGAGVSALGEEELRFLGALVETIIPTTATPGAREANAHIFIAEMLETWYRPAEAREFRAGLAALEDLISENFVTSFLEMQQEDRHVAVASMLAHEDPLIRSVAAQIRSMAITGYYTSEIGATEELRYAPIPGSYEPCVEFGPNDRAWWS